MLSLFACLVWWCCVLWDGDVVAAAHRTAAAAAAQQPLAVNIERHLTLEPEKCGPAQLTAGQPYTDSFRVTFDRALNAEWLRITFALLVSNRTHLDRPGYWPIHRVMINDFDPSWSARLESNATEDGKRTLVHLWREAAAGVPTLVFSVTVTPDATGCYNASGEGLLTTASFDSSDAFLLRSQQYTIGSAMCPHIQPPSCVAYYEPLRRERPVCKLCYGSFVVAAFIMVHLLGR